MANIRGDLRLKANGEDYRLSLGMSVLADLQAEFGNDFFNQLEAPADAPENWMPPLKIVQAMFLGALQRHHADVADRWLVDDLLAQNEGAFDRLMTESSPDADPEPAGKPKAPKPRRR
ncbi:hypothetical protein [Paracoccus aestuariivivens]|uniref:Uncharacterized protein n=1 Tax=Paracoccus aestuariivivens TaxID=1820333 RepID=A0A6L6J2F8_9RHOB|nr:hypothetical protein [Paracoccus aestuariivivens]MTH76313.1 hypothetical protein [Paracoccus aestuariivivens]